MITFFVSLCVIKFCLLCMKNNVVYEKSYSFALRIIKLYSFLKEEKREFVLSKQVLRSGTAIGALISEAKFAQSKADFINKMYVALKEANETKYWLSLLKDFIHFGRYVCIYFPRNQRNHFITCCHCQIL